MSYTEAMRVFFISLLLICFTAVPMAQAQDLFLEKKSEEATALQDLEDALNLDGNTEAEIDTLAVKELLTRYVRFCEARDDPAMTEFSQTMLCACTAAKMQQTMTREEIRAIFTNTKEGRFQRSSVVKFAYTPCMEYPIYDVLYHECRQNKTIRESLRRYDKVCSCIASNMSDFAIGQGAGVLNATDRHGIPSPDALIDSTLSKFMGTRNYEQKSEYFTSLCIQIHEFGL